MTRGAVLIAGPDRTPHEGSCLLSLVSLALVRGYDPVVIGVHPDGAKAVGIMGGELWVIETPAPVVYLPEVAQAHAAWEAETPPGETLRRRKSKLWARWLDDITNEINPGRN